jgi:hypothetical protein
MKRGEEFYLDEYRFNLSKPLDDSYEFLGVLGAGEDGITLHLQNRRTGHEVALKLVREHKEIYLEVEKRVASKMTLFARCYGVFVSDALPKKWIEKIEQTQTKQGQNRKKKPQYLGDRYYGYFYEYGGTSLQNWIDRELPGVADRGRVALGVMFEIFYALVSSFREFGFVHTDLDINLHNITVKPSPLPRSYTISAGDGEEEVKVEFVIDTVYTIRLIDFDRAKLGEKDYRGCVHDIYGLVKALQNDGGFFKYMDAKETKYFVNAVNAILWGMKPIDFGELLFLSEFDTFRGAVEEPTTKKIKKSSNLNCHVCGNISTRALANRPSLTFCSKDDCVLKLGELAYIKSAIIK